MTCRGRCRDGSTQLSRKNVLVWSWHVQKTPTLPTVKASFSRAPKATLALAGIVAGLLLLVVPRVQHDDRASNASNGPQPGSVSIPVGSSASSTPDVLGADGGADPTPGTEPSPPAIGMKSVGRISGSSTPINAIMSRIATSQAISEQVSGDGYINGKISDDFLRKTTNGCVLSIVAAQPFEDMLVAARDAGFSLEISGCYRTYAQQSALRKLRCSQNRCQYSAIPGFSKHGKGLAIDFKTGNRAIMFGDPVYVWLVENASQYGFFHPYWAGPKGATPEPWHWEFGERTVSQTLAAHGLIGKVNPSVIVPPRRRSGS